MYLLFSLFLNFIVNPTKVYIHIEKPSKLLIHTGISFENDNSKIRYDFRAFHNNNNYITTDEIRKNSTLLFPNIANIIKYKGLDDNIDFIDSTTIYFGISNYSLDEIILLEETLNKNYILGINDCRHYVNNFCKLLLNKEIPIWNLEALL